ncbi:MAG: hypothetical protein PHH45_00450 [Patescibacteria group bacterium]|jgi:hypothetical protein|nr:hypothetical protein [Patescibacteria group bacterium]
MNWTEKAYAVTQGAWSDIFTINDSTPTDTSWQAIANTILTWLLALAGLLAVAYLIYSGILYITAAGNPDQAKKGQQGVINAIIGIVIISAVWLIIGLAFNLGETLGT